METSSSEAATAMAHPRLSVTSGQYDRQGKGFLDETEQALRQLDSDNVGSLGIDQVYSIMENLQAEQKRSASLMEQIHREHQTTVGLRKGLIALACFTLLLAVSNIGTSFAAARLAKDTKATADNLFVNSQTGAMLATETRINEIVVEPLNADARNRHLRELRNVHSICQENSNGNVTCSIQGRVKRQHAAFLHNEFCPNFAIGQPCRGTAAQEVFLNCRGVKVTVNGGSALYSGRGPEYFTGVDQNGITRTQLFFPHKVDPTYSGYLGYQKVPVEGPYPDCLQIFFFSIACPQPDSTGVDYKDECILVAEFANNCGLAICGPDADYINV